MSYSQDGHRFSALLNGPKRGKLSEIYQDYCRDYDEFESIASTFRRDTIPIFRTLSNGTQVFSIPLYCIQSGDEKDEVTMKEKQHGQDAHQQSILKRWNQLLSMAKALADHEYVHLMSSYSRVYQNDQRDGLLDVTCDPYQVYRGERNQQLIRSQRTNDEYERLLMRVVYQNK